MKKVVHLPSWSGFRGPQKISCLVRCPISPTVRGRQFRVWGALLGPRGRFYGPGARKTQKTKKLRKPSQGHAVRGALWLVHEEHSETSSFFDVRALGRSLARPSGATKKHADLILGNVVIYSFFGFCLLLLPNFAHRPGTSISGVGRRFGTPGARKIKKHR